MKLVTFTKHFTVPAGVDILGLKVTKEPVDINPANLNCVEECGDYRVLHFVGEVVRVSEDRETIKARLAAEG